MCVEFSCCCMVMLEQLHEPQSTLGINDIGQPSSPSRTTVAVGHAMMIPVKDHSQITSEQRAPYS